MFSYAKQDSRITFTCENGSTIIFDDGVIIGVKGKPLACRPRQMPQCIFSMAVNARLEDTIAFFNLHYEKYHLVINRYDSVRDHMDMLERVFKVAARNVYEYKVGLDSQMLYDTFNMAKTMCKVIIGTAGKVKESDVIQWFNTMHPYSDDSWLLRREFSTWLNTREFWASLPPVEYEENVKHIVNNILNDRAKDEGEWNAMKQAIVNSLISNLLLTLQQLGYEHLRVQEMLNTYFDICKTFSETPNLNGNFLTKYSEMVRRRDAEKDNMFKYQQTKRDLTFKHGSLIVIVPETIKELIKEGDAQHNCVGTYGYDKKVIEGRCNIVFIRHKDNLDQSYITCEIRPNGTIAQFLFAHNRYCNEYGRDEHTFKNAYAKHLASIFQ